MIRRLVLVPVVAVALLAPSRALADEVPMPVVDASVTKKSSDDFQRFAFEAEGDGCWDETADAEDPYNDEEDSCTGYRLAVWGDGKLVTKRAGGFYDRKGPYATPNFALYTLGWTCKRSGLWRWQVIYTNSSVPGFSQTKPYLEVVGGNVRIPRCHRPVVRRVSRETAASTAYRVNQGQYKTQFISSVQ